MGSLCRTITTFPSASMARCRLTWLLSADFSTGGSTQLWGGGERMT